MSSKAARAALRSYRDRGGNGIEDDGLDLQALVKLHGSTCWLPGCNNLATEIGHGISVTNGGDHTFANTRPVCGGCNKMIGSDSMPGFDTVADWDGTLADLLDEADQALARYTGFDEISRTVLVCNAVAARTARSFDAFPRITLQSWAPGSGKSVALKVVGALAGPSVVHSASGSITAAALRRTLLENGFATALVDEVDSLPKDVQAALRAGSDADAREILNVPDQEVGWRSETFNVYSAYFGAGLIDGASMDIRRDTRDRGFLLEPDSPEVANIDDLDEYASADVLAAVESIRSHADSWAAAFLPLPKRPRLDRPRTELPGTPRDLAMTRPMLAIGHQAGDRWNRRAGEAYVWRQHRRIEDRSRPDVSDVALQAAGEWFEEVHGREHGITQLLAKHLLDNYPDIVGGWDYDKPATAKKYASWMRHHQLEPIDRRGLNPLPHGGMTRGRGYPRAAIEQALRDLDRRVDPGHSDFAATAATAATTPRDCNDLARDVCRDRAATVAATEPEIDPLQVRTHFDLRAGIARRYDGGRLLDELRFDYAARTWRDEIGRSWSWVDGAWTVTPDGPPCIECGLPMATYFDDQLTHPGCTPEHSAEHLATPSEVEHLGLTPDESIALYGTADFADFHH